jgi:hypothetical protein
MTLAHSNMCQVLLLLLRAVTLHAAPNSHTSKLTPVSRANLCVTEGAIEKLPGGRFSVAVPKMRAYLNAATPQVAELRFTYFGPTGNEVRLGSGELRRQFGLKMHAQDACNLIYAMWRIEPESKLVVSVKSNPGQSTSGECGNRGYRNIKPLLSEPVPALRPGSSHDLRAEMHGEQLEVLADNALIWEGSVGGEAASLTGRVGMRSDNAHLEFELRAAQSADLKAGKAPGCRTGPETAE